LDWLGIFTDAKITLRLCPITREFNMVIIRGFNESWSLLKLKSTFFVAIASICKYYWSYSAVYSLCPYKDANEVNEKFVPAPAIFIWKNKDADANSWTNCILSLFVVYHILKTANMTFIFNEIDVSIK
jgi:hypothetical protein